VDDEHVHYEDLDIGTIVEAENTHANAELVHNPR
jgi:hypothetical protein